MSCIYLTIDQLYELWVKNGVKNVLINPVKFQSHIDFVLLFLQSQLRIVVRSYPYSVSTVGDWIHHWLYIIWISKRIHSHSKGRNLLNASFFFPHSIYTNFPFFFFYLEIESVGMDVCIYCNVNHCNRKLSISSVDFKFGTTGAWIARYIESYRLVNLFELHNFRLHS